LRVNSGTALLGQINSALYPLAKGNLTAPYTINPAYFYDVSQGNNGGYTAGPTYDFVTGLGVPVANALIPALAPAVQTADFTVAASPATQTTTVGGTAGYTVTTTAVGAFSSAIGLTVSGLPTGATATFSPQSITGTGSSTLAVATSATTPAGTYTLTVTGSSGSLVHTATVTLVVQSPSSADFTIGVTPGSANIKGGNSVSYQVTISANGGFSDNVNLSVSGLPTGATASFSANSVTGSGTSIVTVTTSRSMPRGSYQLTFTGTSSTGTLRHSANANLRIR
jgi:uncharacterized membrane protein